MTVVGMSRNRTRHALLTYPSIMLIVFFLVPFGIMFAISFFKSTSAGFAPAFSVENYVRLLSPLFLDTLGYSIYLGVFVSIVCIVVGLPFTYLLAQLRIRTQTVWLVFILSVLSLSEVIIGLSWSILLSRTAGISNILVWLGIMAQPQAFTPGVLAEVLGYFYLTLPYAVLVLYPPVTRLDPQLAEAARTMGASPVRAFFNVTVPVLRQPIVAAFILVFVFTLGVYLIPQILGRPSEWTLSVLITDQAIAHANLPFAAALAVFLLITSVALIAITSILGKGKEVSLSETG